MTYHQANRLLAHADFSELTHLDTALAQFIALSINGANPNKMSFSAAYLSEKFGNVTAEAVQKSTKRLVDKGIFTRNDETRKPRSAYTYALAVECPADCKKIKAHHTPLELSVMGAFASEKGLEKETDNNPQTVPNRVTNRELNKDDKERAETPGAQGSFEPFSFGEFVTAIENAEATSDAHLAVLGDLPNAYQLALKQLAEQMTKRAIQKPLAWVLSIYRNNPKQFVSGAMDTYTADLANWARANGQAPISREPFDEVADLLCAELGISYQTEFAGSYRERPLKEIHQARGLTSGDLVESFNSVREPSEWLEHLVSPY